MVKLGSGFFFQIFGLGEGTAELPPPSDSDDDVDDERVSEADMLAYDFNNIKNNTLSWFKAFLIISQEESCCGEASTKTLFEFLDDIEDKIHEMQPRIKRARKIPQDKRRCEEEELELTSEKSDDDNIEMEEGALEETPKGMDGVNDS
jgi:hypothetical protein